MSGGSGVPCGCTKMAAPIPSCVQQPSIVDDVLEDLTSLDIFDDGPALTKRPTCERCKRPVSVCWCPFLPHEPIQVCTTVYILQHPFEESRCLRTVPILQNSLAPGKCFVYRGKRFAAARYPEFIATLESPDTVLLYPGPDAVDISELPMDKSYNIVLLDGTWAQAKGIYSQNPFLKNLKKVQITSNQRSKYVIRTQPRDTSLSTLETAAVAIATLEGRPDILEVLMHPLVALCDFQIRHGATEHQSREFRVENGLWTKPLPRSVQRRLVQKFAEQQPKSYM